MGRKRPGSYTYLIHMWIAWLPKGSLHMKVVHFLAQKSNAIKIYIVCYMHIKDN